MFDLYEFVVLCALFLLYSFLGWIIEVVYTLISEHKLINRGFLVGPLVPIWGVGAVLITLILRPDDSWFNLIVSSAFIGTFLEYVVNYLMEKIFKARWWDYSHIPFNINGRVCLPFACLFGIGGALVVHLFNPLFFKLFLIIDSSLFCILVSILMVLVAIDFCVSLNIIQKLKLSADSLRKDYTEEISKKVRNILMNKSIGFKHLLKAFPNVKFGLKNKSKWNDLFFIYTKWQIWIEF